MHCSENLSCCLYYYYYYPMHIKTNIYTAILYLTR